METRDLRPGVIPEPVLRYGCLLVALANAGGGLGLFLLPETLLGWLGTPRPAEWTYFLWMTGFSFNVGVLAWFVYRRPERNRDMLKVGVIGKAIFAGLTVDFYVHGQTSLAFLGVGLFDALAAVLFALYLARLTGVAQGRLEVTAHVEPRRTVGTTRRALVLHYSLTGTVAEATGHIAAGLESTGYETEIRSVRMRSPEVAFPFRSVGEFAGLAVRSILRRPVEIDPEAVRTDHDLVVLGAQTWFVGAGLPLSALVADERHRPLFEGKDAAAYIVCRGLWRRSLAMLSDDLVRAGARPVALRSWPHGGREPSRLLTLVFYLAFGRTGRPRWLRWLLRPTYGPPESARDEQRAFGEQLGRAAGATP